MRIKKFNLHKAVRRIAENSVSTISIELVHVKLLKRWLTHNKCLINSSCYCGPLHKL